MPESGATEQSPSKPSDTPRKEATTGHFFSDLKLAIKRINPVEDFSNVGQIPCARTSLLSGIASGVGIGFIRGFTAKPWVAFNWAMGTFLFVALGTWEICRARVKSEHQRMQVLVDSMPRVRRKRPEELEKDDV